MRSEEHSVGRRAMRMEEQGRRRVGRSKRRMLDRMRDDNQKGRNVGGRNVRPSYMEAYFVKHRPHIRWRGRRRIGSTRFSTIPFCGLGSRVKVLGNVNSNYNHNPKHIYNPNPNPTLTLILTLTLNLP